MLQFQVQHLILLVIPFSAIILSFLQCNSAQNYQNNDGDLTNSHMIEILLKKFDSHKEKRVQCIMESEHFPGTLKVQNYSKFVPLEDFEYFWLEKEDGTFKTLYTLIRKINPRSVDFSEVYLMQRNKGISFGSVTLMYGQIIRYSNQSDSKFVPFEKHTLPNDTRIASVKRYDNGMKEKVTLSFTGGIRYERYKLSKDGIKKGFAQYKIKNQRTKKLIISNKKIISKRKIQKQRHGIINVKRSPGDFTFDLRSANVTISSRNTTTNSTNNSTSQN